MFSSFAQLIDAWPDEKTCAADHGVERAQVFLWRHRDSIPSHYWDRTIRGAKELGIGGVVTIDLLCSIMRSQRAAKAEAFAATRVKRRAA